TSAKSRTRAADSTRHRRARSDPSRNSGESTDRVAGDDALAGRLLVVDLVVIAPRHDGLEHLRALEHVLTAHARRHFRHGAYPPPRGRLLAFLAAAVVAVAQTLERLAELPGAVDEQAPGREAHLAISVPADDVPAVRQGTVGVYGAAPLLDEDAAGRVADPVHRAVQLRFQLPSDVVHERPPVAALRSELQPQTSRPGRTAHRGGASSTLR